MLCLFAFLSVERTAAGDAVKYYRDKIAQT